MVEVRVQNSEKEMSLCYLKMERFKTEEVRKILRNIEAKNRKGNGRSV